MKKLAILIVVALLCLSVCGASAETTLTRLTEFSNTYAYWVYGSDLLRIEGRGGYALARPDGALITEAVYTSSFDYNYGWVIASKEGQGQGIINGEDGKEITPFKYGDVRVRNYYWALCFNLVTATADNYDYKSYSNDNEFYLIDTVDIYWLPEGRLVASLPRSNYSDNYAVGTVLNIEDRATGKVTSYDSQWNALGEVRYTSDNTYAPHYTTYSENGQQGLVDPDGNVVMTPAYRYVDDDVYDGYFTVSTGEKYGLADLTGSVVIPAQYDRICYLYDAPGFVGHAYVINGYVCVENNNKLGYYSLTGGETCPPKYASANLDNNGVSALFTDMAGNINILAADGTETMLEGYSRVSAASYTGGVYYETSDDDYNSGLIDWHGVEILPTEYNTLDISGSGRYLLTQKTYKDPYIVWELSCNDFDAAAPQPAPEPEPAPAPQVEGQPEGQPANQPATAPAGDSANSAAVLLIDNAITMLQTNPEFSATLLESAAVMLAGNDQAVAIVNSAVTLLKADPATNAATVSTLLTTLKGIL